MPAQRSTGLWFAAAWCGGHKPDPQGQRWQRSDGKGRMLTGQGAFSGCIVYVNLQTMVLHVLERVKPEKSSYFSSPHKDMLLLFPGYRLHLTVGSKHLQTFLMELSPWVGWGTVDANMACTSETKLITMKLLSSLLSDRCTHNLVTPSCLHMDILLTSP